MNRINKMINELITILEKEKWNAIDFQTVGAVTIKFALHKPKYKFLKSKNYIQLYDKITDKKVLIDIYMATDIKINIEAEEYEIELDNDQYVKMKMY